MISRRDFLKFAGVTGTALYLTTKLNGVRRVFAVPIEGGTLSPLNVPKYVTQLVKPPQMPGTAKRKFDKYKIAVRQFQQQILPDTLADGTKIGPTTVWSYGSKDHPGTVGQGGTFFYPALTIEAQWNRRLQVDWINDLIDPVTGNYLPHILPVDQTLHWANPPGGVAGRDMRGVDPTPYTGPVPIVTHVHGAHTTEDSDGYPEAWYLPAAVNIPVGYATTGTYFDLYNQKYLLGWKPGTATFSYPNDMRDTTLWYHDHTLGMTRVNVYAGPAGFYLIRGNPDDVVGGVLPGPAPGVGANPYGTYYEIPIVIQDRSFNADGSLFYPDNRAFFEGMEKANLQIPFTPDVAIDGGISDVAPIWNPEFFGNVMVVNGQSWPNLDVEKRRYRFRLLNGCNSRFLILDFNAIPGVEVWQIGADGGFLPAVVDITSAGNRILMAPAERADVIVDFTNVETGNYLLNNVGPDEPFGGGDPDDPDFPLPDEDTTGQVMQFHVIAATGPDPSTHPSELVMPAVAPVIAAPTRPVSLNEEESKTVFVPFDADEDDFVLTTDGRLVAVPAGSTYETFPPPAGTEWSSTTWAAAPFAPTAALLGAGNTPGLGLVWSAPVTEAPPLGSTETWEIHNFTVDAHPIHIHLVQFRVVNREIISTDSPNYPGSNIGETRDPTPGESGFKDTVIAYPGEITRVQATFTIAGRYVWHCHIVEHEDNEMMRPYDVI